MARPAIGLLVLVLVAGCQRLPAPASAQLSSPPQPPPGQVVPWSPLAPDLTPPAPACGVELKVGQASLNIDWISQPEFCPGVQAAQPATAVISIPGGGIVEIPIPLEPSAYPCAGLGVGDFEGPYVYIQPGPPPPLPAISMQVPAGGHIGQALPYLVTLTSDRNQPSDFTPLCPNYEEELFADIVHGSPPLGGKHLYALNCGEAGAIQPGASITFQMVFLVPRDAAPGKYSLTFGLGYLNAMTSFAQAVVTLQ